ncbi:hypothetical protein TNCV_3424961 [Trichonephila clavipes]|nr:hypothetical protein TNCV_3424961 [Trichonephila clavipes]
MGNKIIEALIDSGSSVSLIREDVSKGIIEPSKLSKDISVLIGLGKYEVKTKGSFQRKIELDGEEYSLTWHVVPTPSLEFQAVIGSDILEQASVCFYKESVQFRKHEDKNCFLQMQVYEAEVEDEIVVQHVTNPQIRRELFELISNYEPKKTEMTNDVNKQIDEWLEQGIVRPSSSEYASPIVLVKKKDDTTRLCVDYRRRNRKLVKDRFPLPLIEDVLDRLQGAKVYTTLDLKNGFFHVDVNEDCKHLTSFVVPDGQFEFNKVPFGLSTSPSVFQRYVYSIFRELMRKGIVIIYMDDLVIPAKDEKEGLEKLGEVLEVTSKSRRRKITSCPIYVAEEKYSSYELEVLAVVNALKKFRTYLLGNHFKIITDCSAFQKTMDKKDLVTRVARWTLLLEEYDYEIVHRSGQRMQHVDALSRYPVTIITSDTLTARLQRAQQEDENIQNLKSLIGTNNATDFFIKNEILYKCVDGRELIAAPRDMQTELIKLAHEKGHFSSAKTEEILTKSVGKRRGFLYPIPKEDVPLSTLSCDFIGPLPSTNKRYQHILTIIDAFTKFTWLYPVKSTTLEDALDKLKLQQKTFGNPKRIITDRVLLLTPKDLVIIVPKRKSKICRSPPAYPGERSSGENPPNSNPRFDQVVNRRSYKNGTNS